MAKNIIKLNRGDTFNLTIRIPSKENLVKNYILTPFDVVYFALSYPNQPFEESFLIHGYTLEDQDKDTGEILIKLSANMTRSLNPGIYYYTVKLQRGGTIDVIGDLDEPEEVRTIIERTKFIVNE